LRSSAVPARRAHDVDELGKKTARGGVRLQDVRDEPLGRRLVADALNAGA